MQSLLLQSALCGITVLSGVQRKISYSGLLAASCYTSWHKYGTSPPEDKWHILDFKKYKRMKLEDITGCTACSVARTQVLAGGTT